jgi:putative phage-type endonuclease
MMNEAEWLEERRKGIGASDIAAVMGVSRWKTPYQVYLEKRKEANDFLGNKIMDWGKRMEGPIRQWYSDTTGRTVIIPQKEDGTPKILYHAKYPFLLASLDGYTEDERVVEIKTSYSSDGWGEPGSSKIPDEYMLQVQHQMLVTGYHVADVPVSIHGGPPELYIVYEDKEMQDMILKAAIEFWGRVESGTPPDVTTYGDAVARYGQSNAEGIIFASAEQLEYIKQLKDIKAQHNALDKQEEDLKMRLIVALGEQADTMVDLNEEVLLTYRLSKPRTSFNSKAFKKAHPDLYEQFSSEGEAQRRFLLKGE